MNEQRPKILVVDDDDDFAAALGAYLGHQGYAVVGASSGREGVERARAERPDLVLMDVMMEERTAGFFAIQELRRDPLLADVPVVVVSSIYADVPGFRITPEADWLRHDAFLAKPVDFDELAACVRRLLAEHRAAAVPAAETP